MSERGVCICPACGCQFSDDEKTKFERLALRDERLVLREDVRLLDWLRVRLSRRGAHR